MTELSVLTTLFDPYLNFRFRVRWKGILLPILGVKKVSSLKRSTKVNDYLSGGEPGIVYKVPGATTYDPITLERGMTQSAEFMMWAEQIQRMGNGVQPSSAASTFTYGFSTEIRRDLVIDVFDRTGIATLSYNVYGAWVSDYQAMADLDGEEGNRVLYETITLQHQGWERGTPSLI